MIYFVQGLFFKQVKKSMHFVLFVFWGFMMLFPKGLNAQESSSNSITIADLIFRTEHDNEIGVAVGGIKVDMLEHLRKKGLNALGAENLIFNQDKSREARFLLGGTVREIDCNGFAIKNCLLGIQWELFDRSIDAVVYKVYTYSTENGFSSKNRTQKSRSIINLNLDSLLSRKAFMDILNDENDTWDQLEFKPGIFESCRTKNVSMPKDAPIALGATVHIESGNSSGSGVLISSDGYILTAAHVIISSEIMITFNDDREARASLIRYDKKRDIALLKVAGSKYDCLNISTDLLKIGESIFAIGSPVGKDFSFTLTKGIVSGIREFEFGRYVQIDASVNPGNSGGPIINEKGEVVAITSWKLGGKNIEGMSFGVPLDVALSALNISAGKESQKELSVAVSIKADTQQSIEDEPDSKPSLAKAPRTLNLGPRRHLENSLIGVGAGVLGVSTVIIVSSYFRAKTIDHDALYQLIDFDTYKKINTLGWVFAGLGAGVLTTGIILKVVNKKKRIKAQTASNNLKLRFNFAGTGLVIDGRF